MAQRFKFPLTDQDRYEAKVTFQAFETIPPSITLSGGPDRDLSGLEEDQSLAFAAMQEVVGPTNEGERSTAQFQAEQKVPLDKTTLYLPQSITFQDGVQFDEFALGRVGASVEAGLKSGASLMSAAQTGFQQNINAITDIFNASASSDIARLAATRLARIGGQGVGGGVSSALRTTANPNKRLLFKEVSIREFSFNFKLIPTNAAEADQITKIIRFFRTELYPEDFGIDTPDGNNIPIGYKFPNQFIITFKHRDTDIAHRILPAYLVSMQTTYNPNGMGFFEDGNFTENEVTLNFRESKALSKQEVRDEGY
jgi:hypothetical protein